MGGEGGGSYIMTAETWRQRKILIILGQAVPVLYYTTGTHGFGTRLRGDVMLLNKTSPPIRSR